MRVLLAVDGSPSSKQAIEEVATRPWREGTKLKIFAVASSRIPEWIVDPAFTVQAAHEVQVEEHHKQLNQLVAELEGSIKSTEYGSELEIQTEVVEGYPKQAILDEAEDWDADLIILGAHGYGKVKRFLMGSVSQSVASHAPCSVEIVREKKAD